MLLVGSFVLCIEADLFFGRWHNWLSKQGKMKTTKEKRREKYRCVEPAAILLLQQQATMSKANFDVVQ